ncbi:MAG: AI-2E family transporter [Actinomycetota bacterium]
MVQNSAQQPGPREDSIAKDRIDPRSSLAVLASVSWRILVIAAATLAVLYALSYFRIIVLPVIAALFITNFLFPPVAWLRKHRWPSILATWTVLFTAIGLVAAVLTVLGPPVADEFADLEESLREGVDQVITWLAEGPLAISETQLQEYVDRATGGLTDSTGRIAGTVAAGALRAAEFLVELVVTLVLVFFFLKDGDKVVAWLTKQVPERQRADVREISTRAWRTLGGYIRGVAVIAFVDAVLIAIALAIIGVPLVAPLAMLTFIGGFFPIVGALVAGVIASLVALVTNGPLDALLVAGAILMIQQIEGNLLQPVLMSRAVNLHPVVILLSLTAGAALFGVVGAFLAVPIAAVAATTGNYLNTARTDPAA